MNDKNPWPMLGYHVYPFDFEKVAWDVASMCAGNPPPYKWDRDRLEDGNGNAVIVQDCLEAINAAPAMLLEIKRLKSQLEVAQSRHLPEYWSRMQEKSDGWFLASMECERLWDVIKKADMLAQTLEDGHTCGEEFYRACDEYLEARQHINRDADTDKADKGI